MLKRTENLKNLDTVERERERALFSKIGFICDAKNSFMEIDYETEINEKFISVL